MDDNELYNISDELIDSNDSYAIKEVNRKDILNQIEFDNRIERKLTDHIILDIERTVANKLRRHRNMTLPYMVWFFHPFTSKKKWRFLERSTI